MNTIELRIKYKSDTGLHPVWNSNTWLRLTYNRYQKKYIYLGNPKSEYTKWLEEYTGINPFDLRLQYKLDTANEAVRIDKKIKKVDAMGNRKYGIYNEIFHVDYSIWLEDKICNNE